MPLKAPSNTTPAVATDPMRIAFVHLSDIHFGQEKDGQAIVNDDVKVRLIEDCRAVLKARNPDQIGGAIVTGDIAYSGKQSEYEAAGAWLDALTEAIGCQRSMVQIVPGNHDIDRDTMSESTRDMLAAIASNGEEKLNKYLKDEGDRDRLFARFRAYRLFAEAYDCSLDNEGGFAGSRSFVLAEGRTLRVVGVNSALICAANDKEGKLLLGQRQWVLPRTPGEELVVMTHHPMNWFQDSEDALDYVRSRARVYLSGHEHNPAVTIETIEDGTDLMRLAAGATVPPRVENGVNYCYNIIEFEWLKTSDQLQVTVTPRAWDRTRTDFVEASHLLAGKGPSFTLGCPNFRRAAKQGETLTTEVSAAPLDPVERPPKVVENMDDRYASLLVRFFRDLSEQERMGILLNLGVLPAGWNGPLTHVLERRCLDRLRDSGGLARLEEAIVLLGK